MGSGFDDRRDAANAVISVLQDLHLKVCQGDNPDLPALQAFRDDLDDPSLLSAAREASLVNDKYDLMKAALRLATCLGRKEADWKVESDLTKNLTVVGGSALIVASIGAMSIGPFAVIASIGAGLFAGCRGYFAVKKLEKERHEYEEMKRTADKIVGVLGNV